jgi:hypothetical protein
MINGLTKYLTLDGTDLSYVFLSGTTSTKSGYLLSDGKTDLSDIFASKGTNTANITGYKYISAGIENDINQLYAKIETFGVTFDIALDSQFFKRLILIQKKASYEISADEYKTRKFWVGTTASYLSGASFLGGGQEVWTQVSSLYLV